MFPQLASGIQKGKAGRGRRSASAQNTAHVYGGILLGASFFNLLKKSLNKTGCVMISLFKLVHAVCSFFALFAGFWGLKIGEKCVNHGKKRHSSEIRQGAFFVA